MTDSEIKKYLLDERVCVVTNSKCLPGTAYLASIKSYINGVPMHNFWIIPGMQADKPFYNVLAFNLMVNTLCSTDHFDWVIYIDEDCFINNFGGVIEEFKMFKESGACLAGIQDGGAICHRNHSSWLVNTFLSFWNIKAIRENFKKYAEYLMGLQDFKGSEFQKFREALQPALKQRIEEIALKAVERAKKFRDNIGVDVPYIDTVKDDPLNNIEPHQVPYSFDDDTATSNMEPYYLIEESMVLATGMPVYYLFTTDMYASENPGVDDTGMTSVVRSADGETQLAYHTWFARAYTKWPTTELQVFHTKRINSVIKAI